MNWNEVGLCSYEDDHEEVKCNNCIFIEKIINEICNDENRLVFRALSYDEKKLVYNNREEEFGERGGFDEIILSDDSYQSVINKIFKYVRVTLNNKNSKEKQFSYSRCFVVPLFKYSKRESSSIIVMKSLNLNTFDISYECMYYQWIKGYHTKDEEHVYITEKENTIPIKELFSSNLKISSISSYLKDYYSNGKYSSFESYIDEFRDDLRQSEENQLSLCDLDDIYNIKIQSFTLDLSLFNRKIMNNFLEYCSCEKVKIKRVASFNKDREIISTELFNSHSGEFFIIQGETFINDLKFITVCVLFLENYRKDIGQIYSKVIEDYINKIVNKCIEPTNRRIASLLIEHLKENYEEEFDALKDIKKIPKIDNKNALSYLNKLVNACCKKNLIDILKREK